MRVRGRGERWLSDFKKKSSSEDATAGGISTVTHHSSSTLHCCSFYAFVPSNEFLSFSDRRDLSETQK